MDVAKRVACSSSFAFDQVLKLVDYQNVYRFDIGNALELAQRTEMAVNDAPYPLHSHSGTYSVKSQGTLYLNVLNI